ncbi:MAG: hypothetical protein AB8B82_02975 [Roseovarius sp.]
MELYAQTIVARSTPADFEAAGNALREACTASQTGRSCRILAVMIRRGVVPGKPEAVPPLIDRACRLGDDRACNWMAERLLTPEYWRTERAADYRLKRAYIEAECTTGNDFACRKLVRYVSNEAAQRYDSRCQAGDVTFCAVRAGAYIYPDYDQVPKAEAAFRETCEAGNGMGCIFLADVISSGNGSDFNETQGPHMERACELGVVHGCNVARDVMLAKTPEASTAKRMRYLRPACDGGWIPACLRIATLERWNSDTTKIQYAMALRTDCLEGSWRSCEAAAYAFEAVRYKLKLARDYDDPDQLIQNHFDLAEALKGQ